jgi:hypothetical protein
MALAAAASPKQFPPVFDRGLEVGNVLALAVSHDDLQQFLRRSSGASLLILTGHSPLQTALDSGRMTGNSEVGSWRFPTTKQSDRWMPPFPNQEAEVVQQSTSKTL